MTSRTLTMAVLLALGGTCLLAASSEACAHPSIHSVWPDAGFRHMHVTISGANLADATRVSIGKVAGTFTVSGTKLRATFPTLAVSGHVTVVTPEGRSVSRAWVEGPFLPDLSL